MQIICLFCSFKFKDRLIRLGLSFQKQKLLYLNSTGSQSGGIAITPKNQLWVEDTEKLSLTFSHGCLVLVKFT